MTDLAPLATETPSRKARGIVFILIATISFTSMDAIVRHTSSQLHPFEIAFFRNFLGAITLMPLCLKAGWGSLKTNKIRTYGLRSVLNTLAMLAFFLGLSLIPLAEVTALYFSVPLFAAVLALLILREKLVLRRLIALGIGFLGMLVILRPGTDAFSPAALLILFSSCLLACVVILIKILSRTESSITITAYMGLFQTPMTLIPALFFWQWPTLEQTGWMLAMGTLGTIGQLSITQAYKEADITTLLPFDFAALIWAALLGYIFFAEIPDIWVWIGGGVIFISSLVLAYSEMQQDAQAVQTPDQPTLTS
jgi:drug/metabolite transporter (DMT)-like permease